MGNAAIGLIAFVVIFGGALVGVSAARYLPEHHLDAETRSAVSVSVAIVGTLSALVIGLLISTASHSFSERSAAVSDMSSDIVRIDRMLRRLGPEANYARMQLREWAIAKAQELFPDPGLPPKTGEDTMELLETMQDAILSLTPQNPTREFMRSRALALTVGIADARWKLAHEGSTIPMPFLFLLMFWLAVVFASFGLFAPLNGTAIAALLLCTMAVSGGIVMILDLDSPFSSLLRIPSEPMRMALAQIQQ